MENYYILTENGCKLLKSKPVTVQFLLDYSRSLNITKAQGIQFETNLN